MPPGSNGIVVDVRVFNRHGIDKDERSTAIERTKIESVQENKGVEDEIIERNIKERAQDIINNRKLSKNFMNFNTDNKIASQDLEKLNLNDYWKMTFDDKQTNEDLKILRAQFTKVISDV